MNTRKTFILTAATIKNSVGMLKFQNYTQSKPLLVHIAQDMAAHFKQENPRFNRVKFMEACGL